MGLVDTAYIAALACGVRGGVSPEIIAEAVGDEGGFRQKLREVAEKAAQGKFPEFPYFMEAAEEVDFPLPLTRALHQFLDVAEKH